MNSDVRSMFPFFKNNPQAIYLDSSATTQKLQSVIELSNDFYLHSNANAGRGSYTLSSKLAKKIELVRSDVADFINADTNEITFTAGATDSLQKIIFSLGFSHLEDGDEILYAVDDHKSLVLPWYQLQKTLERYGVRIKLVPYARRNGGDADIADIYKKTNNKTKVIAITHLHNTYGADSDIAELKDLRDRGIIILVDASQSVGHVKVDVAKIGADILVFSGHKMFAAYGSGVLYVSSKLQSKLQPIFVGGGESSWLSDISNLVEYHSFSLAQEAGTLNAAAILSLSPAISFIESIGFESIEEHLGRLTAQLIKELSAIKEIVFAPGPKYWSCIGGYGVVSFSVTGFTSAELSYALDQSHIMVRTGQFCRANEKDASLNDLIRVSLHLYNDSSDVSSFVKRLSELIHHA